ncbi:GNAT family N-acetyltransferase [Leifsonia sp. YIM 134122]|uniref:GNAT family N-acetyltransferase n=1 Tax=Leifsonia stereocauli TaxID=3134136 RepID=A0ABU9VZB1_9MICO
MTDQFLNEPDANRYVLLRDGVIASSLDYSVLGDSISMTRAYTNPRLRGHGLAGELVEFAVDDVERTTRLRIIPMCWYVAEWFESHPERAGLLKPRSAA